MLQQQPFFENMLPALQNFAIPGSASANVFCVNNNRGREAELDTLDQFDRQFVPFGGDCQNGRRFDNCVVVTGCFSFFGSQFSALRTWENMEVSNFHGLTVSMHKRYTRDLTFDFNFIYELPFGRGKKLGATVNGAVNQFIGGWQLSGLTRYRTGLPFDIANGSRWSTNFYGAGRALVQGQVETQGGAATTRNMRFNRTGMVGPRNIFRGDDLFNTDLALGKRFYLPFESHSLQFRWEVFNSFNNVNFSLRQLQNRFDRPAVLGQYREVEAPRVMQFALRYEF